MSTTVTRTQTRQRAYSISIVAALPSKITLDTLPSEVLLDILRYAIPQPSWSRNKVSVSTLAVVNRTLYAACAALIYRTVVLRSPRALALFARTAKAHPALPAAHVRSLAFTCDTRMRPELRSFLGVAIRACSSLHTLVIPGAALPGLILPPAAHPVPAPKHVTLNGWGDIQALYADPTAPSPTYPADLFRQTTHLSLAGPPAVWARPCDILHALGGPTRLTHLCLARRTGGNTDNDAEFVSDVLALRTRVKNIVVSMCPNVFASRLPEEESAFAGALKEMGVKIREGDVEEWHAPWTDVELGAHASGLEERFWADIQ
ncbi:hypothetical protein K488DRAFT_83776 [Vararia minispora EC-137]|uniref:Uncharacterized protein n=1 Tax=Vararia minispora EC-137 TaxID=1314806 RepID=A0ACB8QSQ4_9AGAM|nr:hypothetical protein K488DRAFT_83776 [Vararia minispora EC-137]